MSAPCQPGATAAQCAYLEQEVVRLLQSRYLECANSGLRFKQLMDAGSVAILRNPEQYPHRFGGSDTTGGSFNGGTAIHDWAFEAGPYEVGATIAHEVFGHQMLNNLDEGVAESYAILCGGGIQ